MATAKLATLIIRTAAKPISSQLKAQAKEHGSFRNFCVSLAQWMHRGEIGLRTGLLGEPVKSIRPLSETRAIENGANALAEGFLFAVAAGLILAEAYRSSRSSSKRREDVDDQLELLTKSISDLTTRLETHIARAEEEAEFERQRHIELSRILERVVTIGLRGGWAEFEQDPVKLPRTSLTHPPPRSPPLHDGSDSNGSSSAGTSSSPLDPSTASSSPPPTSSDSSTSSSHARVAPSGLNREPSSNVKGSHLSVIQAELARLHREQHSARAVGSTTSPTAPVSFAAASAWSTTKSHLLTQAPASVDWELHEDAIDPFLHQPNTFTPEADV